MTKITNSRYKLFICWNLLISLYETTKYYFSCETFSHLLLLHMQWVIPFSTGIAVHRYVKFQFCFVIVDCCYILMQAWLVCVCCRPFAGDGIEIGSLLVPMVLTSQMAFIERWESKYLKVTGIHQRSHVAKENTKSNSVASPACISDFWHLHLQCFSKSL